MQTNYTLGIDIGTGSTKAVAIDAAGATLHTEQVFYPTLTPRTGWSEQAPELIWQAFIKCISRTVRHFNAPPQGIGLSTAMHSLIAVNKDGDPLMNMITWADNRSAAIAERIRNGSGGECLYQETGTPVHTMAPVCKIIWLKEHEPELFAKTHKFISIKEYVWFKLFGVFEVDYSIASATGLFAILKNTWSDYALTLAGISTEKLSISVPTSFLRVGVLIDVLNQTGLTEDTPIVIGASDGCMANLGSFATHAGVAALTIGTSGAIRVASTKPVFNFRAMTFNYRLDENTFICGGPINNGGVVLKWYAENFLQKPLTSPEDYAALLRVLDELPSSEGLIFLPYILGERAPLWNSETCGVFFGIHNLHKQAHFTRAVIEGISMALLNIEQSLEEAGLPVDVIHVSGGFIQSTSWLQLLADLFGKEVVLIGSDDASALGAAYLSLKTNGAITDYEQVKPRFIRTFTPKLSEHEQYKRRVFPIFKSLSQSLQLDMRVAHELQAETEIQ